MCRSFVPAVLLLSMLVPVASFAQPGIPDPFNSVAPTVRMSPGGILGYDVEVRDSLDDPVVGALVDLLFSPEAEGIVCWCSIQVHPVIQAVTDSVGIASFQIAAGGCVEPDSLLTPPGVEIFADGIPLAEVGAVSMDYDANCVSNLGEVADFYASCLADQYDYCKDLNGDGRLGLEDLVIHVSSASLILDICQPSLPAEPYPDKDSGANDVASVALHLEPAPLGCFDPTTLDNCSIVTEGVVGGPYMAYLLISDVNDTIGVSGLEFSLDWDPVDLYVDPNFTTCATADFGKCSAPSNLEPGGSLWWGRNIVLEPCPDVTSDPGDDTEIKELLGYMYVYAYAPTVLQVTPDPLAGVVNLMECGGEMLALPASRLGSLGFGGLAGFNPTEFDEAGGTTCYPDSATTPVNVPVLVSPLLNDVHPCSAPLTVHAVVTTATQGTAVLDPNGVDVLYTPPPGWFGTDQFDYLGGTVNGVPDTATVWVTVNPGPGIPDPVNSSVPPVLLSPGGYYRYTVEVRDYLGDPVPGALVDIAFSTEADALVCWCAAQVHPLIQGTTDAQGLAHFQISGGGCVDPDSLLSLPGVVVTADGVTLAEVGAVSPDLAGGTGEWSGDCIVTVPEIVVFTTYCFDQEYNYCLDLNGDGRVGMEDALLVGVGSAVLFECIDPPPFTFPYDNPGENTVASLAIHLEESPAGPPSPCSTIDPPCLTNGALATEGVLGQGYTAYLMACDVGDTAGITGAEFALGWDAVDLYADPPIMCDNIGPCLGPGVWGPGAKIWWADGHLVEDCIPTTSDPDDDDEITRVLGHMYVYAYAPTTLSILPYPDTGVASLMECGGETAALDPGRLGSAGFGGPVGYNPTEVLQDSTICLPDSTTTDQDTPVLVSPLANDVHPCPGSLEIRELIDTLTQGSVALAANGTDVLYTPPAGWSGVDQFLYRGGTQRGVPDSAVVWVTVLSTNAPPIAAPDSAWTKADSTIAILVLANDTDPDGDSLGVSDLLLAGTVGTVSILPDSVEVEYIPEITFDGWDLFQYVVSDGNGGLDTADVHVHVDSVAVPPGTCDDLESGGWTFGHVNLSTNCTWHAETSTAEARSPVTSIWTYLASSSAGGQDFDHPYARKEIPWTSGAAPGAVTVWFNLDEMTGGGSGGSLGAYSRIVVAALDTAGTNLAQELYVVAVYDDIGTLETRDWVYLESTPIVHEPGAPAYGRNPDGSIVPGQGWWYRADVTPGDSLLVDWAQVATLRIQLQSGGGYMYGDQNGMFWDDVCVYTQTPPSATVFGPNGAEVFEIGDPVDITWSASSTSGVDSVTVEYSTDDGSTWIPIAGGEPNDGHYGWTAPAPETDLARVRVVAWDPDLLVGADVSDAVFRIVPSTSGAPDPGVGLQLALHQNRPNPFVSWTRIPFTLPGEAIVRLRVFSISGALVSEVHEGLLPAGDHVVRWPGTDRYGRRVPPGIYLYRLDAGPRSLVRKAILIR